MRKPPLCQQRGPWFASRPHNERRYVLSVNSPPSPPESRQPIRPSTVVGLVIAAGVAAAAGQAWGTEEGMSVFALSLWFLR